MDSFAGYMAPHGWRERAEAIAAYWRMSGYGIFLAVHDGARITRGDYHVMLGGIIALLSNTPCFIIVASMGADLVHDFTPPIRIRQDEDLPDSVARGLASLRQLAPAVPFGLTYGGSSLMWQFEETLYDMHVRDIITRVGDLFDYVDNSQELSRRPMYEDIHHNNEQQIDRVMRYLVGIGDGLLPNDVSPRAAQ